MSYSAFHVTFNDYYATKKGGKMYGKPYSQGFSGNQLRQIQSQFEAKGCLCEWVYLNQSLEGWLEAENAALLVIRGGMKALGVSGAKLFSELNCSEWPSSTSGSRTSISKGSRKLLVDEEPSAEGESGGGVVAEKIGTAGSKLREAIQAAFHLEPDSPLIGDAWRLQDVTDRCTIPFHELHSKISVGVHAGHPLQLHFRWRYRGKLVSDPVSVMLQSGDIYIITDQRVNLGTPKMPKLDVALGNASACWKNRLELQVKGRRVTGGVKYGPDSWYIPSFMQDYLEMQPEEIMGATGWNWIDRQSVDMRLRSKVLPRTKSIQHDPFFMGFEDDFVPVPGDCGEDGEGGDEYVPRYGYTGWQVTSMENYIHTDEVPVVHQIMGRLNGALMFRLNGDTADLWRRSRHTQCIATMYRDPHDEIGGHDDKTADSAQKSLILIISAGEPRELHLWANEYPKNVTAIKMEPGSLFVLGPLTNQIMKHSLVKVEDELLIQRQNGEEVGPRISLVFREITSYISKRMIAKRSKKLRSERSEREKKRAREEEGIS